MKDDTTRKLVDLLIGKLGEGLEVRIILDEIVNQTTFVGKLLKKLEHHGAEIHRYNPLREGWKIRRDEGHPFKQFMKNAKLKLKQHFHEKYMIVDGVHLILGGINWGDKYAFGGEKEFAWRDSDVYLRGPVVREVQIQFFKDFHRYRLWAKTVAENPRSRYYEFVKEIKEINSAFVQSHYGKYLKESAPLGPVEASYIAHKPYDDERLPLTNTFLDLIASAKDRIYWGCHGIRPPRIYGEYFASAIKRGVEVILITNSKYSSRSLMVNGLLGWMYWECTKHYRYLLENGIRIFEWQKKGAFHSKNLVIDDKVCSIGSYNIARGSTYHHTESNVLIFHKPFIEAVAEQFNIDLKSCKEVTLNEFGHKLPKADAFKRMLHERDLLIRQDLMPKDLAQELSSGNYKRLLT